MKIILCLTFAYLSSTTIANPDPVKTSEENETIGKSVLSSYFIFSGASETALIDSLKKETKKLKKQKNQDAIETEKSEKEKTQRPEIERSKKPEKKKTEVPQKEKTETPTKEKVKTDTKKK
jgi:hypothetical protein